MKRFIILFFIAAASNLSAQDMRQNSNLSLFSDHKAARQGDAITIIVMESTSASNNAQTSAGRKSALSGGFTNGSSLSSTATSAALNTGNEFSGTGSTQTTGNINTKISASVDTVLANGNLVIHGSKKIKINGEEQTIHIKGIVRPSDVSPENAVLSYNISEAEIEFDGSGLIDNAQKPGWLTKLFHLLF